MDGYLFLNDRDATSTPSGDRNDPTMGELTVLQGFVSRKDSLLTDQAAEIEKIIRSLKVNRDSVASCLVRLASSVRLPARSQRW